MNRINDVFALLHRPDLLHSPPECQVFYTSCPQLVSTQRHGQGILGGGGGANHWRGGRGSPRGKLSGV